MSRPYGPAAVQDPLPGAQTLPQLFQRRAQATPDRDALRHLGGSRVVTVSWAEWERRAKTFAVGLLELDVAAGDRVAIMMCTRLEWALLDLAVAWVGAVTVPIFPTESSLTCAEQLADSGARVIVVEDAEQLAKVLPVRPELAELRHVVVADTAPSQFNGHGATLAALLADAPEWLTSLQAVHDEGERQLSSRLVELDERAAAGRAGDVASIAYSPGTEGRPKGVMLTHGNYLAAAAALLDRMDVGADDVQLLYLPLAQVFARIGLVIGIAGGIPTALARSYKTVLDDCAAFEPTFIAGVPRLYEKVQAAIESEMRNAGGLTKLVLGWDSDESDGGLFVDLRKRLGDSWVARRVRSRFGGKLRFAISGGAPLGLDTARFFHFSGLPLLQGYGMTETCGATSLQSLDAPPGTCGRPLLGVQVRIAEDSELVLHGAMITSGYWQRPEETQRAIDADGWFSTGDLAQLDELGQLVITGRKRDVIVTANGKAIASKPIAEAIRAEALIGQVLIHGDRRSFLTALIGLDPDALEAYAHEHGIEGGFEELARHPKVFATVDAAVQAANSRRPSHEHVRKFAILGEELSPEGGDLTAAHSMRPSVAEKYRALLDSFYSEHY